MKVTSEDSLIDKIEKDSASRKKELTYVKLRVSQADGESVKYEIRSAILLLYAHWEGSIKNISERYLCYISYLGKDFASLAPNFYVLQAKRCIKKFQTKSNKYTAYAEHLSELENLKNEIVDHRFYEDVIRTQSNLNYDVLIEILDDIGYTGDRNQYLLDKGLIDESLLGSRNEIAHGGMHSSADLTMNADEYCFLHDKICYLIESFKTGVLDMIENKSYLAPNEFGNHFKLG